MTYIVREEGGVIVDGQYFREPLHAQWDRFFSVLGIARQYQIEGVRLRDGRSCLPDFVFDGMPRVWVFIRRRWDDSELKVVAFNSEIQEKGERLYIFQGTPEDRNLIIGDPIGLLLVPKTTFATELCAHAKPAKANVSQQFRVSSAAIAALEVGRSCP